MIILNSTLQDAAMSQFPLSFIKSYPSRLLEFPPALLTLELHHIKMLNSRLRTQQMATLACPPFNSSFLLHVLVMPYTLCCRSNYNDRRLTISPRPELRDLFPLTKPNPHIFYVNTPDISPIC